MNDNDKGLFEKYFVALLEGKGEPDYEVTRIKDRFLGEHVCDIWKKTTDCFVLSPFKDDVYGVASRAAIMTYAETIQKINPTFADDLRRWVGGFYIAKYGPLPSEGSGGSGASPGSAKEEAED